MSRSWRSPTRRCGRSAQARYAWFQRTYPKLQNIMQLKDVATFLGITPVTLSRIRARETISAEKDDAT